MDKFQALHQRRKAERDELERQQRKAELVTGVGPEIAALLCLPAPEPAKQLPELTEALRGCTPRQRIVLRALADNAFVVSRTAAALGISRDSVSRTLSRPNVAAARKVMESMAADTLGITAASTIARINEIVEGNSVLEPAVALRGLETLAKVTGAVKSGAGVNVGVQVMVPVEERYARVADVPGIRVIDAEFSEVKS